MEDVFDEWQPQLEHLYAGSDLQLIYIFESSVVLLIFPITGHLGS